MEDDLKLKWKTTSNKRNGRRAQKSGRSTIQPKSTGSMVSCIKCVCRPVLNWIVLFSFLVILYSHIYFEKKVFSIKYFAIIRHT
jgi:hypothetical protein